MIKVKRVGEVTLYAVDDKSLADVLKRVGIYDDVVNGKARCYFCGQPVAMENLGGLFKHEGLVRVACSNIKCLYEAAWLTAKQRTQ
jgi:hypothetical protein